MSRLLALLALISVLAAPALSADSKMNFSINHRRDAEDDVIGRQLVFRLKEEVRKSSQLELVAGDGSAVYSIDVSTLVRTEEEADPISVMYAATLSIKDMQTDAWLLLDQTVGYAGRERLQDAATGLMVWIDKNVETAVKVRLATLVRSLEQCKDDKAKKKDSRLL